MCTAGLQDAQGRHTARKQEAALLTCRCSKRKVDGCAVSLLAHSNRRAYSRNNRWTAPSGSASSEKSRRRSSSITQMANDSRYRTLIDSVCTRERERESSTLTRSACPLWNPRRCLVEQPQVAQGALRRP